MSYLSNQEPFEGVPSLQVHAPDHAAHQVRSDVLHLGAHSDRRRRRGVRDVQDPHHHPVQLLLLVFLLFLSLPLLLPQLLPPALVRVGAVLCPSPFAFPPQVVQDGLGLAAVDHLLQAFVAQLVALEVDVLQLGAVAQLGGDLAQLVVGEIEHLVETEGRMPFSR